MKAASIRDSGKIIDNMPMGNVFEKRNNFSQNDPNNTFNVAEEVRGQVFLYKII
jgi:hypothetical protein